MACQGKGVLLLVPKGAQIGLAFRDGWSLPSRCNTLLFPSGRGQDKHQPELQLAPLEIAEGTSPVEDKPGKPQDLVVRGPNLRAQLTAVPALAFQRAVGSPAACRVLGLCSLSNNHHHHSFNCQHHKIADIYRVISMWF